MCIVMPRNQSEILTKRSYGTACLSLFIPVIWPGPVTYFNHWDIAIMTQEENEKVIVNWGILPFLLQEPLGYPGQWWGFLLEDEQTYGEKPQPTQLSQVRLS